MKCFFTRWQLSSHLDTQKAPPAWSRRHAASCAKCSRFQARLYELDAQLATAADDAPAPASSPARANVGLWALAAAGAAAAMLVVFMARTAPAPVTEGPPPSTDAPVLVAHPGSLAAALAPMARKAERLSLGALDRELELIAADSRSGVNHLLVATGLR